MWALEGSELLMAGLAGKRPVCGSPGWASSPDWGELSRDLSGLGGDRALRDLLAWSCQELDGGQGYQQRQGQADDDLAGGPVPEHQGQAGQRDRDDPQCPPVGVDPGPDGAGAQAGAFGAAPQPADGTGNALASAGGGDRLAGQEPSGGHDQPEHEDGAQPGSQGPQDGLGQDRRGVVRKHVGGGGGQVERPEDRP